MSAAQCGSSLCGHIPTRIQTSRPCTKFAGKASSKMTKSQVGSSGNSGWRCSVRGVSGSELAELAGKLDEQVEANIGMVCTGAALQSSDAKHCCSSECRERRGQAMIYALVSAAQDWLREKARTSCSKC